MAFESMLKRHGRHSGNRRGQLPNIKHDNIVGVNYAQTATANQSPNAWNTDFGDPMGMISKSAGFESLFASMGTGKIAGVHTWKHSSGEKFLYGWGKDLYLLTGQSGSMSIGTQDDWKAGTMVNMDADTSPGDLLLVDGTFNEVATLTADFDGTHDGTVATGDQLQLSSATVPAESVDIDFYGGGTYGSGMVIYSAENNSAGQTFTAGATTKAVSKITIKELNPLYGDYGTVTLKVYSDDTKSTELGSSDLYIDSDGSHSFDFDPPVLGIEGGQQCYMEITTEDGHFQIILDRHDLDYAGGCSYGNGEPFGDGTGDMGFTVYKLDIAEGTYTHGVQDPSTEREDVPIRIFFNTTVPDGTEATIEARVSSDEGATWGDWTARESSDILIDTGVEKTGYRVQWRAYLMSYVSGNNPSVQDVTVTHTYASLGQWESIVYDLGNTPESAILNFTADVPADTTLVIYAQGSNDGVLFGDWEEVITTGAAIPALKYLRFKAIATNDSISDTPKLSDMTVVYSNALTQYNKIDIAPLQRTSDLLTGNRVRFANYQDLCVMADGLAPFGAYYDAGTQTSGTVQGGAVDSVTLAAGESAEDDIFNNTFISITDGPGKGQVKWIEDYNGTTKAATPAVDFDGIPGDVAGAFSGGTGSPRYVASEYTNGLTIEEGSGPNLLTANQSNVETDTTGFTAESATITRDTSEHWEGSASLKIETAPGGLGAYVNKTSMTLGVGEKYTGSVYLKGDVGKGARVLVCETGGGTDTNTGSSIAFTGDWQRLPVTHTITDAANTELIVEVVAGNPYTSNCVYADGWQLEKNDHATPWIVGGSSISGEVLTIPTAGTFVKESWSIEPIFTPTTDRAGIVQYLWDCYIDANNRYSLYTDASGYITGRVTSGGTEYTITSTVIPATGTANIIMFAGDGEHIRLCVDGSQAGSDTDYVEPVGTLPANMYLGSDHYGAKQANGVYDDTRFSHTYRAVVEHKIYASGTAPHVYDEYTNAIFRFDSTVDNETASTYSIGSALRVRNMGLDVPTTAPSGADSGVAGNPNGVYTLKYTYVDEDGTESNPSDASAEVTVSGKKIIWTFACDATAYNRTAKRRLYRTEADGEYYKFLAEIADNTTTTYTDDIADVGLGDSMYDNNNKPPSSCSIVYEFSSYLFYVDLYWLWYSKAGEPDHVPNISGDIQMLSFPGYILAVHHHPYGLLVSGQEFLSTITNASDSGFIFDSDISIDTTIMKNIDASGALSHEAVALCTSPSLNSFDIINSNTGLHAVVPGQQDGSLETTPLSVNIQPFYDRTINREQAAATFFNNRYIYCCEHINPDSGNMERLTFAYDMRTNQWYGPWEYGMSCFTVYDNVLYGGDAESGKIYRMFTGSSYDGENIHMICDLPPVAPATEAGTCKFKTVLANVNVSSDTTSTLLKPKVDDREATIALGALTSTFTGDVRPGHNSIRTRKHQIPLPKGHTYSLRIEDDSTNPVKIESMITEYEVLNINK